jgi:hypothetical protein
MSATSLIYKKLTKENNRPLGENSPNLVTLSASEFLVPFFAETFFVDATISCLIEKLTFYRVLQLDDMVCRRRKGKFFKPPFTPLSLFCLPMMYVHVCNVV